VSHRFAPGYYDALISRGKIKDNMLILDDSDYREVQQGFRQMPSVAAQAKNLVGAIGQAVINPKRVSQEERERRLSICRACEFLVGGKRCLKCGCGVNWKSRLEAWHCPIEKW
jgi:hypothetical protein